MLKAHFVIEQKLFPNKEEMDGLAYTSWMEIHDKNGPTMVSYKTIDEIIQKRPQTHYLNPPTFEQS